jgi:hypothetical protein
MRRRTAARVAPSKGQLSCSERITVKVVADAGRDDDLFVGRRLSQAENVGGEAGAAGDDAPVYAFVVHIRTRGQGVSGHQIEPVPPRVRTVELTTPAYSCLGGSGRASAYTPVYFIVVEPRELPAGTAPKPSHRR